MALSPALAKLFIFPNSQRPKITSDLPWGDGIVLKIIICRHKKYKHKLVSMVRETGLEPARRKAYAPKAYVYTNFTTRAAISL